MASVNKWIGIGNLGADPEVKYTASSKPVCNMTIACNEVWKDARGQKQERVEWVRLAVWGDQAENCAKYLSKGRQVYVEGRLQTNTYEKNGEKRYSTQIVVDKIVFLGGGGGGGGDREVGTGAGGGGGYRRGQDSRRGTDRESTPTPSLPPPSDDDIPF